VEWSGFDPLWQEAIIRPGTVRSMVGDALMVAVGFNPRSLAFQRLVRPGTERSLVGDD